MQDLFRLDGKRALVTGASRGIGRTLSLGLHRAGAELVLVSRTREALEGVAAEIAAEGGRAQVIAADVRDAAEVQHMVDEATAGGKPIDILVNCAGVNVKKPVLDLTPEEFDLVISTNLRATFLCCQAVGRLMVARHQGKIINIGSVGSILGITRSSAYCASKGGVAQLTKVLALEWAPYNVQVNALAPGFFHTDLSAPVFVDPVSREKLRRRTPDPREPDLKDLVGATVFLASPAADYVTGVLLPVDGGFTVYAI